MRTLWLFSVGLVSPLMTSFFLLSTAGCDHQNGPSGSSNVASNEVGQPSTALPSPNLSFAAQLGVSAGPVSESDARRIAELATGGTAVSVEQEDEDATAIFEVMVRVGDAMKEVEVRISDGAVIEIEDEESKEANDSEEDEDEDEDEDEREGDEAERQ